MITPPLFVAMRPRRAQTVLSSPAVYRSFDASSRRGFSLVEILSVLGIMALLAGFSLPMISGLSDAGRFDQSVDNLSTLLDQCHAQAVANDTYVYVGMVKTTDAMSVPELWVVAIASSGGTDVSFNGTQAIQVNDPNNGATSLCKVAKLQQLVFEPGSQIGSSQVARPSGAQSIDIPTSSTALFGPISQTQFSTLLRFNPDGTASNNANINTRFEFAVQSATHSQNVAVIQVSGLTGVTKVYLP